MKRAILSLSVVLLSTCAVMAQSQVKNAKDAMAKPAAPATTLTPKDMDFKEDSHNFGTVAEGPKAEYEFTFRNLGKEPIVLTRVQASCGCTTPSWSKEPIAPGKESVIKASYNTQGRPGPFTKSITVVSNAGTKVLTIKGTVEKAPTSSVPQNNSMMKTN